MIKIGDIAVDLKSLVGIAVAILGWIVGNSAVIIPTIPQTYQPIFGNIVVFAGLLLNVLAHAPYQISKTPMTQIAGQPTAQVQHVVPPQPLVPPTAH